MLIWWSRLAAMVIVLLPIGGGTYYAQADGHFQVPAQGAAWLGLGLASEPGAVGLLLMGCLLLLVRCTVGREVQAGG